MLIVSACLVGVNTNYTGESREIESLVRLLEKGEVLPVCPEQLGGLPTPRPPAEITGGTAQDVLSLKARLVRPDGTNVTPFFVRGACEVLRLARLVKPDAVIFKERSPSCGVHFIYDGTHSGRLVPGCGLTTAMLQKQDFRVISDEEWPDRKTRLK